MYIPNMRVTLLTDFGREFPAGKEFPARSSTFMSAPIVRLLDEDGKHLLGVGYHQVNVIEHLTTE